MKLLGLNAFERPDEKTVSHFYKSALRVMPLPRGRSRLVHGFPEIDIPVALEF